MRNKAVNASIKFEKIGMVMINDEITLFTVHFYLLWIKNVHFAQMQP